MCVDVLKVKRENVDSVMRELRTETEKLLNEELQQPRITGVQRNRDNMTASNAGEYFKRSILIPYLDRIISDVIDRIDKHNTMAMKISALLPCYVDKYEFIDIEEIITLYQNCCPYLNIEVREEYDRWVLKWKKIEIMKPPRCPAEALAECDRDFYPAIYSYLKIYCCLPTTTASSERTFSTLKYLKNYLRSTISETKLNRLARLYIHKDTEVNIEEVIDTFALKRRKADFVL